MFILDKRKWCTSLVAVCTRSARHTSAINLKIDCTGKENRCLEIPLRGSFVSIFQNHPAAATCLVRVDDILRPEKKISTALGKMRETHTMPATSADLCLSHHHLVTSHPRASGGCSQSSKKRICTTGRPHVPHTCTFIELCLSHHHPVTGRP